MGRAFWRWPAGAKVVVVVLLVVSVGVVSQRSPVGPPAAHRTRGGHGITAAAATTTTTTTTTTTSAAASTTTAAASVATSAPDPVGAEVDQLAVVVPSESIPPYRRARFGDGWEYDPSTGCNTRERVLIQESLDPPAIAARCHPIRGRWVSLYDGATVTDPAELQIDHLVALSNAWQSGAYAWTDDRRVAFANDLTDPATLIAVTGTTNASKSDSSPDRWMPPRRESWCAYAASWVHLKRRWSLTVTPSEKAALVRILEGCA